METMTSSFPLSALGHNHVQLDNFIFYSGPASAKTREITPIGADEWPDIDMIFAEDLQHEWVIRTKHLDPAGDFEITGEDIRSTIDTGSAAQAAISAEAHLDDISMPLCNSFDHSRSGFADRGRSAKSQEPLDVRSTQMGSVPAGTSDTVRPDVQHNSGDVGTAVQECPLDGSASFTLWEAFRGEKSTSALGTNGQTSPPRPPKTDGPNLDLPMHTQGLSPGCSNIDIAPSDKSPLEEWDRVQQPQLIGDCEQNSSSTTVLESSAAEQDRISEAACDTSANTVPSEASTCDRAYSSHDAADIEGSDSDGPPLPPPRCWTRPRPRSSLNLPPFLTPRSRPHSVDVKSTTALHRRKRLHRRKGTRGDSPTPKTDDTSTSLTTSVSSRGDGERWPVQCFIERKMIGSQEMITIQMPPFDLCARSGRVSILSLLDDTSQATPNLGGANAGRHGARFSRAEEDLLTELKGRREPKLSWREIHSHFPQRTMGSLQVHYSTQLKMRRPCRRAAAKKMY